MYCSQECVLRSNGHATYIEIAAAEALEHFGIDFVQQWSPKNANWIYDFKIGRITLEVNGDYWHNLPGAHSRDRKKEEWALRNGLIPVTIWEHEINDVGALEIIENRVLPLFKEMEDCFA